MREFHPAPPPEENPLTPVATPEELAWWQGERRSLKRHIALRFGLPGFAMPIVAGFISKPERLLTASGFVLVGVGVGLSLGMTWLYTRLMEPAQRVQAIRWKRIRESLAAEP